MSTSPHNELDLNMKETVMIQNSDALKSWKWAFGVIYFVAAMNVVIGMVANSNSSGQVGNFQFNGGMLFGAAALYLILAICVQQRNVAALWIALGLFALDGLAMVAMT